MNSPNDEIITRFLEVLWKKINQDKFSHLKDFAEKSGYSVSQIYKLKYDTSRKIPFYCLAVLCEGDEDSLKYILWGKK